MFCSSLLGKQFYKIPGKKRLGCFEFLVHRSPGYILLDAVKAALGAVLANVGKIEGESPHFGRAVRPGNCDVLRGWRKTGVTHTATKAHFLAMSVL